jgi:hypothetical protein
VSVLFVRAEHAEDLEAFSKKTLALLNLEAKETRFSDNWPGGRYVYKEALGLEIRLSTADNSDFPDYDFMIDFQPQIGWAAADVHCLDGFADVVGRHLARQGMKLARSLDYPRAGSARVEY